MNTSRYPTRVDAARATPYSEKESKKLSKKEQEERMRKFNASPLSGKYFSLL
ncbi:hypothetical protein KKJ06_16405 [Xenorhabdus bovienii]|uniref:hypothetical protein n=1 Tax=Xenorhabdus bovienii TaxID=40576 RepID=UPI0012D35D38|nr:hypothetical protein [Xenorhabdus bovienii]MDE9480364.1 hypothetical protein [Xenorhabdus bovienii]MDE9549929.1 hypothetical protein [Xenorhabdus bovienii]MDE9556961.1 hypothetical protein [Xenorhabdus bovienii]MDE9562980.1 hypothetical protein [Xenorhabdus bovienii]